MAIQCPDFCFSKYGNPTFTPTSMLLSALTPDIVLLAVPLLLLKVPKFPTLISSFLPPARILQLFHLTHLVPLLPMQNSHTTLTYKHSTPSFHFVISLSAPSSPPYIPGFFSTHPALLWVRNAGGLRARRRTSALYLASSCRPYLYPEVQLQLVFLFPDPWVLCSVI